jgi:Flp pilus assembly pilin Flp
MRIAGYVSHAFADLLKEEAGASLMEYAIVGTLVLVVCMLLLLAWDKQT